MTTRTDDLFLARLFNVRAATVGPVTAIYDRGWLGDLRETWQTRIVWLDVFNDDALGVQLGPVTVWWERGA